MAGEQVDLRNEQSVQRYYAALYLRDPMKPQGQSFADWFSDHIRLSVYRPRRTRIAHDVQRIAGKGLLG